MGWDSAYTAKEFEDMVLQSERIVMSTAYKGTNGDYKRRFEAHTLSRGLQSETSLFTILGYNKGGMPKAREVLTKLKSDAEDSLAFEGRDNRAYERGYIMTEFLRDLENRIEKTPARNDKKTSRDIQR